jgi:hypothetical protein
VRRFATLTVLAAVLAVAAPAAADPFGELPFYPVSGVATCLRATGEPGGLARWVPGGVELLRAMATGVQPAGRARIGGRAPECPEVAAAPGGAAAVAELVVRHRHELLRVAVREPGGAFQAPVTLGRVLTLAGGLSVAVAPTGDVVVAVADVHIARRRAAVRVVAFRRRRGGRFGRGQRVAAIPLDLADGLPSVTAGMDAAGDATLAWGGAAAEAVSARPTARFGAPQRLGRAQGTPALAEAPDGRALVAWPTRTHTVVAERGPGRSVFGPPVSLGAGGSTFEPGTAAALRADGAAVVAWSDDGGAVAEAARPAPGAFGRAVVVANPERTGGGSSEGALFAPSGRAPFDELGGQLRAAVAGDAFALAWARTGGLAHGALGRLDGTAAPSTPGGRIRPAISTTPVVLAGGALALAWADDTGFAFVALGGGRVHLAVAGARRQVDPAAPGVTIPRQARQRRYADQPLRLTVACAAACDVRVSGAGSRSRPRAGRLSFEVHVRAAHPGRADVPLTVNVSGPGGRRARTLHVRVPELVRVPPPVPQPLALSARRRGSSVVVRWRVAFAGRHVRYFVLGSRARSFKAPIALEFVRGGRAGAFRTRLTNARRVRFVRVVAISSAGGPPRSATVPVTG